MRKFVRFIDDEYLSNDYDTILDVAHKGLLGWYTVAERMPRPEGMTPAPEGVDASVGFPLTGPDGQPAASLDYLTPWFPGRSYAEFSMLLRDRYDRCEEKHKTTYRQALLDIADIYMTIGPEVQFAQYPDNVSDVVELLRYVYKLTDDVAYLHRADQIMRLGLQLFFDETSPLPKITNFDDWYESSAKNESSVQIMRQMLELSLDLEALPEDQRATEKIIAKKQDNAWHASLNGSADALLQYGAEKQHGLYLTQSKLNGDWRITLSDTITHIPSVAEADKLNGRQKRFTGKREITSNVAYGGFKDVPVQVTLVICNKGKRAADVSVTAALHDTYHDNGQVKCEKTLKPGEEGAFVLNAPSKKWIRHLTIDGGKDQGLQLEQFAFAMVPRSKLTPDPVSAFDSVEAKLATDGLVLHLSGEELNTIASGSPVGQWKNKAAPKLTAVADGNHRPAAIRVNGRTVLRFDGKDDFLTIADNDSLDMKAWTVIAVARPERGPGVLIGKIDKRNFMMNYRLQVDMDGKVGAVVRGSSAKQQVNRQARVNALKRFTVIAARFDPKAMGTKKINISVDGMASAYSYENAAGKLTELTHDGPLLIGRQPGRESRHFKGDIAGILLYNRTLSDEELNSTARWLYEQRPGIGKK
jgi:hypothetical protein